MTVELEIRLEFNAGELHSDSLADVEALNLAADERAAFVGKFPRLKHLNLDGWSPHCALWWAGAGMRRKAA